MGRKKITVGPGGKIRIKRTSSDSETEDDDTTPNPATDPSDSPNENPNPTDGVSPSTPDRSFEIAIRKTVLTDHAEVVTEAQVRPEDGNQDSDVELLYGLSGDQDNHISEFHGLSSSEIVMKATDNQIQWLGSKIPEYIETERGNVPAVVIHTHTHPNGSTQPSTRDMTDGWPSFARTVRNQWPATRVLFAIHALRDEYSSPADRSSPTCEGDKIVWNSPKRKHELRIFDHDANTVTPALI
jgi:proteasome lid subunit RPN8/RPN11